ncbi:MAG: formylglycine-generating enzyme family protein [Pseudomonadota bacterium]
MTSRIVRLSRADLLRLIGGAKLEEREAIANLVGFERREPQQVSVLVRESITFEEQAFQPSAVTKVERPPVPAKTPVFWRVVEQRSLPKKEIADADLPNWWTGPPETTLESTPLTAQAGASSLLHWPRLLGFYRTHLIIERRSNHPDERRFVRQIAEARFVRKVPRKTYRRWPQRVVLVIDHSHALYPLWRDYAQMKRRLQDLFGVRLKVIRVAANPDPTYSEFQHLLAEARLTPEAAVNAHWLILSDLGGAGGYTERESYWQAFLHWLHGSGLKQPPLALVNAPVSRWWYGLGELAQAAFWDIDQPLRISRGLGDRQRQTEPDIGKLLAMLSMAPEARPSLLRELRHLLPLESQDVSWEITAWNHPDVLHCLPDCTLKTAKRPRHQKQFLRYLARAGTQREWPYRALDVITSQLAGKPAFIRDQAKALERAAKRQTDDVAGYLVETIKELRELPEGDERDQRLRWVVDLLESTDEQLINANEKLEALRYLKDREHSLRGESTAPLDNRFEFIFRQQPVQVYLLWQRGTGWGIAPDGDTSLPSYGSPLGTLRSRNQVVGMVPATDSKDSASFWTSGAAPAWASDWGEDEYGPWAVFRIEDRAGKPIAQRLRWIEPGSFQMGSPEDEALRDSNEIQHQVTLTQGYWLADTASTQGLWQAVMGENPSDFKGVERPVERVSWKEIVAFIEKLNIQVAGLGLRLPSEAEWEYACRAGTQTPFWFGENITPEQVNYDGNYPYAGRNKGQYRKETMEVKALPCNGWGLYQMHGNVWEWCNDRYGAYPEGTVKDPMGPEEGEGRVLRGGGWGDSGWFARSAQRNSFTPDNRNHNIGFRLARGQSGAEPAGPRSARQAERRADAGRPKVAPVPQLAYGVAEPPLALPQQRLIVASDREELTLEALTQPDWAETIGRDRYGLFVDFSVQGVSQRLRWINPGRFFMGSPDAEAERLDDETRHEVILSQGFWLADTACTQALWEGVMGKNPSDFKGAERPVERVSWKDTMTFLDRLNEKVTGLDLRLPTEAEREYACRAGTQTPFWFGENITTDQVNYNGEYPYADGEKGEVRGETVEVKALPCNGWGFYQMHGNVWEWCNDWYGEYPKDTVTDPIGCEGGEGRVLRGGSWYGSGGSARSARRSYSAPVIRYHFFGFRLARGQ